MTLHPRSGGLISVALLVGALLLVSCATPAPPSSTTPTTTAKPYGSLKVQWDFRWGGLVDPPAIEQAGFQGLGSAVFDSLVEVGPDGRVRPGLAERWEISSDGRVHTFYLRKGVKFQDGSDLTAADVKFSIERMLAPDSRHGHSPNLRRQIDKVELKDDYTVVLNLKGPQYELLAGFESDSGTAAVVPKKYVEEKGVDYFRSHPIGSGPWKVVAFEPDVRVELEALESHWRTVPKFKNITVLNVREESTKVAMLNTGELDMANEVAPDSAPGLRAAGVRIVPHNGGSQFFVTQYWDREKPTAHALGDVRVRKALSLAINRQELADKLYGGFAEPSVLYKLPKASAAFFDPNVLNADPNDREGAKKLLAEAGYPNGFNLKIWDSGQGGIVSQLNEALAGYWRNAGVNVTVEALDYASVLQMTVRGPLQPRAFGTVWTWLAGGGAFQFDQIAMLYHSRPAGPTTNNPRLDEAIDRVPLTADPAERKRLQLEATVMAKNEYLSQSVLDLKTLIAIGPKVGEFAPIQGMSGLGPVFETISHAK